MSYKAFVDPDGGIHTGQQVTKIDYAPLMEARSTGRKILVPLDGSPSSERALAHALWMMVTQATDHLLLLHVHETNGEPTSSALVPAYDDKVLALINDYSTHTSTKVNFERKNLTALDARAAIVQEADAWGADYICLGARGGNCTMGRAVMPLGSTADFVLRNAPCSVIVVRKRRPGVRHT